MAITLWGRRSSCNVQKVLWALGELNLRHHHVELGGRFGGLDTDEYGRLNPNRKVPTLRDGDLVIWESHAIVRYLAAKYSARGFWQADPGRRAVIDQWTDWTATTFQPAWISLFWLVVRTPAEQHDAAAIGRALADTNAALAIIERRLAEAPFLGGGQLSYADIAAGVAMYRWITMPIERPELPNVGAWFKRLTDRPPYKRSVCVTYADLVGRLDY